MASPDTSLSTQRPDLADSFMEFDMAMQREGFIATRVLPVVEVAKQAGTYGKIPIEQLLKQRTTLRAPGAGYARSGFTFTKAAYSCDEHGAEEVIDDRERKMYASYFDAELIASQRAMDDVLRNAEIRVAAAIFNATTWTSHTTGITNEWDDARNAVPVDDVEGAAQSMWDKSGLWPNAVIMDRKVFRNLLHVDQVVERIKYSGHVDPRAGAINEAAIATLFNVDEIIVAGAPKNDAIEGQTVSIKSVWDDEYVMVCRVARSADFKEPAIGRTFHWAEDGSSIGGTVESYRDEPVRSDVVRVRHDVDEVITYVEAGWLLSNATS